MKKSISLNVAFYTQNNDNFVVFSSNIELLDNYLINLSDNIKKSVSKQYALISPVKDKEVHKIIKSMDIFDNVVTMRNIHNLEQLYIWLNIKYGVYVAKDEWSKFLDENNLINDWIDGNLVVKNVHCYSEKSKEFGYKKDITRSIVHLKDKELWSFPQLFNGEIQSNNNLAKYSYKLEAKIVEVMTDKVFIKLNEAWLNEIEPPIKSYRLR